MDKIAWNKFKNDTYCTIRYYGSVYGDIHIKKKKKNQNFDFLKLEISSFISKFREFKSRNYDFIFL